MVLNALNASGKVASSPVFSSRYSLLIDIYDFHHINDKVNKYEDVDEMPQYFNYGVSFTLKTMNSQANDGTYNLKDMLVSFNNEAELEASEASHKAKILKIKVEEQEQVIYKMQKEMIKYSFKEFEEANDILHELEGRRLKQLKIIEEYNFLDEITDKIYYKLSNCIFEKFRLPFQKKDQKELEKITPNITKEAEKLFDYIFEYGKQLEIIKNDEMCNFETKDEEEENEDTDTEENEAVETLKEELGIQNRVETGTGIWRYNKKTDEWEQIPNPQNEDEDEEEENEDEDEEEENEDENEDIENEDTSNLDLEEEYKFYKKRTFELVDEKEELQRLNSDLKNELEDVKKKCLDLFEICKEKDFEIEEQKQKNEKISMHLQNYVLEDIERKAKEKNDFLDSVKNGTFYFPKKQK